MNSVKLVFRAVVLSMLLSQAMPAVCTEGSQSGFSVLKRGHEVCKTVFKVASTNLYKYTSALVNKVRGKELGFEWTSDDTIKSVLLGTMVAEVLAIAGLAVTALVKKWKKTVEGVSDPTLPKEDDVYQGKGLDGAKLVRLEDQKQEVVGDDEFETRVVGDSVGQEEVGAEVEEEVGDQLKENKGRRLIYLLNGKNGRTHFFNDESDGQSGDQVVVQEVEDEDLEEGKKQENQTLWNQAKAFFGYGLDDGQEKGDEEEEEYLPGWFSRFFSWPGSVENDDYE